MFSLIFFQGCAAKKSYLRAGLPEDDVNYIYKLAEDTWRNIDYYVAPETGFPYDSDTRSGYTNTTSIGLYLASITAAHELGFLKKEDAIARIRKILDSLEKLEKWNGFLNNWISVKGITKANPGPNYISDFNKLPAALIVARQEFPEVYEECTKILEGMNWSIFYNRFAGTCYSEYDIVKKKMGGALPYLASDTNLASFFMVAAGGAPVQTWQKLNREKIEQYGLSFYKPGWNIGGLFMQAMSGIFMDDRKTELGKSTADFAYVQMLYAKERDLPVWGWSSSFIPGEKYTEGGFLLNNVVSPHASVLAIIYYPNKVVENLRKLESLGARKKFQADGALHDFGFCDAINIKTGKTTVNPTYLTSLDQTMLFLSLANYLGDGVIWRLFDKDPIVKKGKELLSGYFNVENNYLDIYDQRDKAPLNTGSIEEPKPETKAFTSEQIPPLIVDDFDRGQGPNNLGGKAELWKLDPGASYAGCVAEYDSENKIGDSGYSLKMAYDVDYKDRAACAYSQPLEGRDLRQYNCLSFYIKGDAASGFTKRFKLEFWDANNVVIVYFVNGITDQWQKISIPFDEFKGILSRWDSPKRIGFVFENRQDFYQNLGITNMKGVIYIDNLAFERTQ